MTNVDVTVEHQVQSDTSAPRCATPWSGRTWRRIYLVAALSLALASALIRLPLTGSDEFTHATRMVTLGNGLVIPATADSMAPHFRLDRCESQFERWIYMAYLTMDEASRPRFGRQFAAFPCAASTSRPADAASSRVPAADINPPVPYLPAAIGYRIGRRFTDIMHALLWARIVQALAAVALTWVALRILPRGHALFTAVALLPAVVQFYGTVSADPVSNASVFIWLALVLRTIDEVAEQGVPPGRRRILALSFAAVGVAVCKPFLLPSVLVALAIPRGSVPNRPRLRDHAVRLALVIGPSFLIAAAWRVLVASRITVVDRTRGANSALASHFIERHPVDFLLAAARGLTDPTQLHRVLDSVVHFGVWPHLLATPPYVTPVALLCVTGVAAAWWGSRGTGPSATPRSSWRIGLIIALVIGELILIQYGLALDYERPGARIITGIQGRYLVPLIPLVYLATRSRTGVPARSQRVAAAVGVGVVIAANIWALGGVATFIYA